MIDIFFTMCIYAFSMSITPGPTNIISMASGVNHGFKKSIPFATGAAFGFALLLIVIGIGLGQVAGDNEIFLTMLSYFGAAIICYMGYRIATAHPSIESDDNDRPSFLQGAILQWFNPKSWIASIAGVGAFKLVGETELLLLFVSQYIIIGYSCVLTWAYAGSKITRLLKDENKLRLFNRIMGGGLIFVAIYLLIFQIN